ncbi:MAG TPA: MBL fold metallo-hydrolase [Brevefilum sp.]|nr:MBL fold metallo-hydrolase [Brevefilum sp.]HOR19348.1 MBL fold metallo-hydrolase [Brevefilum sp.]HPL69759.1 MBL fold metallo-hydrolase [Brevefilum sp.]
MATITFLGTANALPNKDRESTHFLVESGEQKILVDCAGNPIIRFDQAGLGPCFITDIILTHFHPDHVAGLPILLLDLLIMGRKDPLNIYGLDKVIDQAEGMLELFEWQDWGDFFPVQFHRIPDQVLLNVLNTESVRIWTSPVHHLIPTIGVRMQFPGGSMCYSSDTEPCDNVVELARGVDILIHEATGGEIGHSLPEQAGEIAQRASASQLLLIHYPSKVDTEEWVNRARSRYSGQVQAAKDWMRINI